MTRTEAVKQAFADAAPYLREFQHALQLGRLVICAQCREYDFNAELAEVGNCLRHGVSAYPFVPFRCDEFAKRIRKTS